MIHAEFLFELLVVFFDGPALVRQSHQFLKRGVYGEGGEVVLKVPSPRRSISSQRDVPG